MPRLNPNNTNTHRQCSTCKEIKPLTVEYFCRSSRKSGFVFVCKPCLNEDTKKNAQKLKLLGKSKNKEHSTKYRYKTKYGLSMEEANRLIEATGGRCSICCIEFSDTRTACRCVDHCHTTGKVRGIICFRCNLMLGYAEDKPDLLLRAIEYLDEHAGFEFVED